LTPFDSAPSSPIAAAASAGAEGRIQCYHAVRETTRRIAARVSPEDMTPQSMPDASPAKWHLAHTAWFFETFLLKPAGVAPFDPAFHYLFNSYYEALGERHPRPSRGLVTRPGAAEVMAYREHVDRGMVELLARPEADALEPLLALGLAHEEQHQELMLTDLLHLFSRNPLRPAYLPVEQRQAAQPDAEASYSRFDGGIVEIGHSGREFAFDIEGPRHEALLRPYAFADRLTTNGEWLCFMEDGGYRRPELWLSDGWARRVEEGWEAPLYWERDGQEWRSFGLHGMQALQLDAPVAHVSFFEADAYARWRGERLPSEAEWEHAAANAGAAGARLDSWALEPQPSTGGALSQMFGDVWEWTASPFLAYPGYRPTSGAVGEYNGKFMNNQYVLRGGSCVTPPGHVRASYRNFFQPHQRWQFSGVRLARDV
jgi:ergothioneine biosynthesis protein EgtB